MSDPRTWFSVSVLLTRADGKGGFDLALRLGNWLAVDGDAARGAAVKMYMNELPQHNVSIVLASPHTQQTETSQPCQIGFNISPGRVRLWVDLLDNPYRTETVPRDPDDPWGES